LIAARDRLRDSDLVRKQRSKAVELVCRF
jgi:hypothetical protein